MSWPGLEAKLMWRPRELFVQRRISLAWCCTFPGVFFSLLWHCRAARVYNPVRRFSSGSSSALRRDRFIWEADARHKLTLARRW